LFIVVVNTRIVIIKTFCSIFERLHHPSYEGSDEKYDGNAESEYDDGSKSEAGNDETDE
jgi:hypothetical protein